MVGLATLCALASVADGGASGSRASLIFSVGEARGVMAQYHPSAYMATRLPPKIGWVDVGGGCQGLGPGAPACYARLEYNDRRTGGRSAFQAAFFSGHLKARIVKALRAHDGRFGSQTTFTAGKFSGVRERQVPVESVTIGAVTRARTRRSRTSARTPGTRPHRCS